MKFYLDLPKQKGNVTTYTHELLKYLIKTNGHELTPISETADYCLISLTGYQEFNRLVSLRKRVGDKKIIVGGHAGFIPNPLLAYADYVNVGQGFDLFSRIGFELPENMDFIMTRDKQTVIPNQYIDWNKCPLIQISKNSYSYLYSIGCRSKCAFCYTSWHNKYQKNPKNVPAQLSHIPKGKHIYLISNDFEGQPIKRMVSDATVKEFAANPATFEGVSTLRFGIESPSEHTRKVVLKKPITDEEIETLIRTSKDQKKRIKMFMLVGLDDEDTWLDFINRFPQDNSTSPKLELILNYFEPMMGTPMENYNLRDIIDLDIWKFQYRLKTHNHRTLVWRGTLKSVFPIFRAVLSRSSTEDAPKIWKYHNIKDRDVLESTLDRDGFGHYLDGIVHKNPVQKVKHR